MTDDPAKDAETTPAAKRRGRHAAGMDPAKRDQILDGARCVFMDKGFDNTSVSDICKAAGVSKGTIYVYFSDKSELFEALIRRERARLFSGFEVRLQGDMPLREKLIGYGEHLAEAICSDYVIRAQRIVIGQVEKMPELVTRFYDAGAKQAHVVLQALLDEEVRAGRLDVPDTALATYQLVVLCTAGLWRQRIFAKRATPPSPEEISKVVESGVDMFLRSYQVAETRDAG